MNRIKTILLTFIFLLPQIKILKGTPFEYKLKGNRKTKNSFVHKLLDNCIEKEKLKLGKKIQNSSLSQCIMNSKLFSSAEIEIENNTIKLEVKERISLIPIPMLKFKSDGTKDFNILLFESNLFGVGKLLGLGLFYSSKDLGYFLFFRDPSFNFSKWTWGTSISQTSLDLSWKTKYGNEIYKCKENKLSGKISIGKEFLNNFTLSPFIGYNSFSYDKKVPYKELEAFNSIVTGLNLKWDKNKFKFYYLKGFILKNDFYYEAIKTASFPKAFVNHFNFQAGKKILFNHALEFSFNLMNLLNGDERLSFKSGFNNTSNLGLRGTPDGAFWTDTLASLGSDYKIPLYFSKFGLWVFSPFMDVAFIKAYKKVQEDEWLYSYGIGSYFYLKQIMLPGMGLVLGRHQTYNNFFIEFSIGARF